MSTTTPATLRRSVTATAWYIGVSVVLFVGAALFVWAAPTLLTAAGRGEPLRVVGFVSGSVLTLTGLSAQLVAYHRQGRLELDERATIRHQLLSWHLGIVAVGGILLSLATTSPLLGVAVVAAALCVVRWPRGVRLRVVVLLTLLLTAIWLLFPAWVDAATAPRADVAPFEFVSGGLAVGLPGMTGLSLWSWDIVTELDRARSVESRLAATQERLRLAGELHDLQGHHLQVIALQLELAERMLARDPDAAADQIRLARASVDAARDGTRELAGSFRGVPLPDELANAADLLRAAGLRVRLDVAREAASAPADLLGTVVRECTTNVLKHGGGRWAELSLHNIDGVWRLRVANDPGDESRVGEGAGLEGIAHRVATAGGDVQHRRTDDRFEVVVTVPVDAVARGGNA